MFISFDDLLFPISLLVALIILRKAILNRDFFKPAYKYLSSYNRNLIVNSYINDISRQPEDPQKIMTKEVMIFVIFSIIMFVIISKSIFFTAVVSGSMVPTFERNDLILMQNFDHSYKIGDIIMFIEPLYLKPVSHRIVQIKNDGVFKTAGDFSGMVDLWEVPKSNILGKAILINGKPIVIKRYGRFFIVDAKDQQLALFGDNYRSYFLFFEVIKLYGYVIIVICIILYIAITFKQKSWQNR